MPYNYSLKTSGTYTTARNCFMGQSTSKLALDYAQSFFKTYNLERKFFHTRIISTNEYTGESNRFVDEEIADFLKSMDASGHLDNTILMFYSSHGDSINSFMKDSSNGVSEKMNPFMFMMVPELLNKTAGKFLKANQQKLVTNYHLFSTLFNYWKDEITPGPGVLDHKSLISAEIDSSLDCEKAHILNLCQCT